MGLGPPAALWDLRLPIMKVCDFLLLIGILRAVRKEGAVCGGYVFEEISSCRPLKRWGGVLSLLDGEKAAQGLMLNRSGALAADGKVDLVAFQLSSRFGTVCW
jgi:hypothetical protein